MRRTRFLEHMREKRNAYVIQGFSGDSRRKETPWKPRARWEGNWKLIKIVTYEDKENIGLLRKISPPLGFEPGIVQSVANRYTDYSIPERSLSTAGVEFSWTAPEPRALVFLSVLAYKEEYFSSWSAKALGIIWCGSVYFCSVSNLEW